MIDKIHLFLYLFYCHKNFSINNYKTEYQPPFNHSVYFNASIKGLPRELSVDFHGGIRNTKEFLVMWYFNKKKKRKILYVDYD